MRTALVGAGIVVAVAVGVTGSALATHLFTDVPDDGAHTESIQWAHENAIVEGYGDGTYRPGAGIRRDQAATMLHRYDRHVDRKIAEALPGALEPMPPFDQGRVLLDPGGVHVPVPVYVADNPDLRRQGLRGVEELPREAGMVFLYESDTRGGFTMRDTLIPLSIAFFDSDGTVLTVMDMEPCEAEPCPTYDPEVAYRGALEVNRGRFEDLGLGSSGWQVDVPEHLMP